MNDQTMIAALAALLHDLGKFWQRAGRLGPHDEASAAFVDQFEQLFPDAWKGDIRDGARNHHRSARTEVEKIVRVADWLASAKHEELGFLPRDADKTPLLPVTARVEFREEKPSDWQRRGFRLNMLDLEEPCIFPITEAQVSSGNYHDLWGKFEIEVRRVGRITDYFSLIDFLALLRKYCSFIPSATPWEADEEYRALPDISLYDHLKVASAIAICLTRLNPDHLEPLYRRDNAVKEKTVCLSSSCRFLWDSELPLPDHQRWANRGISQYRQAAARALLLPRFTGGWDGNLACAGVGTLASQHPILWRR